MNEKDICDMAGEIANLIAERLNKSCSQNPEMTASALRRRTSYHCGGSEFSCSGDYKKGGCGAEHSCVNIFRCGNFDS